MRVRLQLLTLTGPQAKFPDPAEALGTGPVQWEAPLQLVHLPLRVLVFLLY